MRECHPHGGGSADEAPTAEDGVLKNHWGWATRSLVQQIGFFSVFFMWDALWLVWPNSFTKAKLGPILPSTYVFFTLKKHMYFFNYCS